MLYQPIERAEEAIRQEVVLLLLLFQGSALVSRAQPDRERLAAAIDALRPR